MLNWVLAILAIIEARDRHLSDAEATYLGDKLPFITHPHKYQEAKAIVEKLLKEIADQEKVASK